jgi:hypothetical protein
MKDTHFDGLAKSFSPPSRRSILVGAVTAALTSLMAVMGRGDPDTTSAAKRKKRKSGAKNSPGPAGPPGPKGAQGPPGPVRIAFAQVNTDPNGPHLTSEGVSVLVVGTGEQRKYCFSLPFRPIVAVGSPHFNNSAVVATVTEPHAVSAGIACPPTHSDAAARTFAASGTSDGTISDQVHFRIIFL